MSEALDQAKDAMRLAGIPPTGDDLIDAAIAKLGRPLSPNETFNVAEGLSHDYQPPYRPPEIDPLATRPDEHPEDALRRQAEALAADATA